MLTFKMAMFSKSFTRRSSSAKDNKSIPLQDNPLSSFYQHDGLTDDYDFSSSRPAKVGSPFSRYIDSFRRNPNARVTTIAVDAAGKPLEEQPPAQPAMAMKLKNRHLQMIGFGGAIGTGLFVGSGSSLAQGGPASLVLAYGLIGVMLYCTVHALGELGVQYPIAGSFAIFANRFLDPAWAFAMGWNYALQWLITLPLEIIAASLTLSYWPAAADINPAAWVTIFLVFIVILNLFGVKGYGEAEFVFSIVKVTAVIGFIILGIILNVGGGPNGSYIGGKYWQNPGAFHNGFKGLCSVFVTAAFAFSGTELVGLAAAESVNPRKSLPTAVKQIFWRIVLFYVVSLLLVGLLVPYNDPRLINSTSSVDAKASPFVISIENAGIEVLPSVFNVVILISVLSVGNTSVYATSRTLAAMADRGQAPRILGYVDRSGRPLTSILLTSAFGLLCYFAAAGSNTRTQVFNWLIAISGLSTIITWATICLCHIRFRSAWHRQGHTLDSLAFKSQAGLVGSWIGLIFNILVLIAQFWTAAWPLGYESMSPSARAESFFEAYLAAPVTLIMYIIWKVVFKTKIRRSKDMDITSGRREEDDEERLALILEMERLEKREWPRWKRIYKFFC
ncbi:putative amino acid permease [Phaeomoniella chlamydospora]|uniref:Putative amino acid permease n=1 Tax=Phaeomoniella chlamydospora TaxID=158046 RepID=A0A0G2GGG1_PHACM|nr:putative amino acid permease [Phaeomoniella chlamydospora]